MMKITHYTESLNAGGIASFLAGLVPAQAKKSEVEIVTVFKNTKIPHDLYASSVKVDSLCKPSSLTSYVSYPFKIYNRIKKSSSDIIHIHCSFVYYIIAIILLHTKKRFFYTVHSDAIKEKNSSRYEAMIWPIKKYLFKKGWIHPILVSQESEHSFYQLYGFHAKVILNGIPFKSVLPSGEIALFRQTSQTKLFIHAGRITEAKNQIRMCNAFKRAVSSGIDAHLIIVGPIQDASVFSEIRLCLDDRIHYLGSRDDVLAMLKEADFLLLPSNWEGMPMILLEALSQGCIPVCSPVGGITNVIRHMNNGILLDDPSEDSIFNAIKSAVSLSSDEISELSANCEESSKIFSIEDTAEEYMSYYSDLRIM